MNWLHRILRDPECKGNIVCVMLAFIIVIWGIAFFIYAMARLSATDFEPVRQLEQRMDRAEYEFQWLTNEVVSDHSELVDVGRNPLMFTLYVSPESSPTTFILPSAGKQ